MTSLFSRLQKLNKEATPGPWVAHKDGGIGHEDCGDCVAALQSPLFENSELIVECRNSLPAVLNLIEAAQTLCDRPTYPELQSLREAVAVFVSGQEECVKVPDWVWEQIRGKQALDREERERRRRGMTT